MSTSPTRPIRTSTQQLACDVCGRTLLRGERAEVYLSGAARHSVCELCTARALHGGWVREGTVPDYGETGDRVDRRRSLLRRRRRSRGAEVAELPNEAPPPFGDEFAPTEDEPPLLGLVEPVPELDPEPDAERPPAPDWPDPPARSPRRGRRRRPGPFGARSDGAAARDGEPVRSIREPRHVHAVPTSVEHKVEAAIELFNGSEHPRTVAGITRSLGLPDVSVHPSSPVAAIVNVVVVWELCWYRYEIDLSEEVPAVRGAGQGYELSELSELEQLANVTADERGVLSAGRRRGSLRAVIYCVVPEALADELLGRLSDYYADDPNVTVIVDRRRSARRGVGPSDGGAKREVRDRRRPRIPGELPSLAPAGD